MVRELKTEFEGKGEVKGYSFKQILKNKKAYLYEVANKETNSKHYEVFKRTVSKIYDFREKKILNDRAVTYPKSKAFGVWAWTSRDYLKAVDIYEGLIEH